MSRLEKISKALAGETLTGAARGVGEAIGYVGAGGDFADVPEVLRDAIKEQRKRTELGTQGEKDAYGALQALGLISNPLSQIGAATDFAGALPDLVSAIPERAKAYIAGEPEPVGQIAESGLKRRLAKGGAQAEYAKKNQLERAREAILSQESGVPNIAPDLKYGEVDAFMPISSTGSKWPYGEGKFQVVNDYGTRAYDVAKNTFDAAKLLNPKARVRGMGRVGKEIIQGYAHDLGVEFGNTIGLAPEYRGKGYGKAIYQNMADVYGGGISHSGSTSQDARNVYKSLGAIDTGIPSGGGTRQALPTTAMKNDPAAMTAFEAKVKEYANEQKKDPYGPYDSGDKMFDMMQQIKDKLEQQGFEEIELNLNDVHKAFGSYSNLQQALRQYGYRTDIDVMRDRVYISKRLP